MEKNKNRSRSALGIAIILLLLTSFGDLYLLKKNSILVEDKNKALLHADSLLSLKLSFDKEIYSLNQHIVGGKDTITAMISEIERLKIDREKNQTELKRVLVTSASSTSNTKKLKELQKTNTLCSQQIEELTGEINKIKTRNSDLLSQINSLKAENEQITAKLERGKTLRAYDILVEGFKNDRLTQKAKRVKRIEISFLLPENDLAEAGSKEINTLVYNPKGQVLSLKGNKFLNKTSGKEQVYSTNKTVNYANRDLPVRLDFGCNCKLEKGDYKAEIYVEGKLAGKKEFALK